MNETVKIQFTYTNVETRECVASYLEREIRQIDTRDSVVAGLMYQIMDMIDNFNCLEGKKLFVLSSFDVK